MLLSLVKRGHPVDFIFYHHTAVFHAMRTLTNKSRLHDPSRRTASMPGTWASSLQSKGYAGRMFRRKRKARTPCDRRLSVWQNSISGVDPDIVPRVAARRKGAVRLLPSLRQVCARAMQITSNPSVSAVPFLPNRG
ncbi:hypothetical protein TcCL_ESM09853 [Trypanosoma cruzi]|nr:hypothetical protein TcCL_ESM09853 [Trypanosoma cruzi]